MRKSFWGCSYASGKSGDDVLYPHPFLERMLVVRKLSEKPVKLSETVAENDAAFGGLGREGSFLLPATKLGFPNNGKEAWGHPRFVGVNSLAGVSTAVKIDPEREYDPNQKVGAQYTYVIDYPRVILAAGKVPSIPVVATLDKEQYVLTFVQEKDELLGANRLADDFAYGIAYDPTSEQCIVMKLRMRAENSQTAMPLPTTMNLDTLFAYSFTCRAKGKPTGKSACILGGDTNRVAVQRMARDLELEIDVGKSLDKLNRMVDREVEALAAAREKKRQEEAEKVKNDPPSAKKVSEDEMLMNEIVGESFNADEKKEDSAFFFSERMHVLAGKLYAIKQKIEKMKEEGKK